MFFFREEWASKQQGDCPIWTSIRSDAAIVPQQGATTDCAIYTVLFAQALHNDIPVSSSAFSINGRVGRAYVAHCLLTSEAPQVATAQRERSMSVMLNVNAHREEETAHLE